MKKMKIIITCVMLIAVLSCSLAGCAPSNKDLTKQINSEIKESNVLDAPIGSYSLPKLSEKLIKNGVKIEYIIKDYFGNSVEVKDGKFNVSAGGEYTLSLTVKNKKGKILVNKTIRITENGTLSYKLNDADIADLKVKRDKVLVDIFAARGYDYAVYKQLSYLEKMNLEDYRKLDMIANVLNDELLTSGLSKEVLTTVFDNVSALCRAKDDLENKDEDVPKFFKELFDKAFAPILSGAESSIAIANIIHKQYINYAYDHVNKFQTEYDVYNATGKAANDIEAMTDEQLIVYMKTIRTNVEAKIAELVAFESVNDEAAYLFKLYNTIAEYGALPTISSRQLEHLFALNQNFKKGLKKMKPSEAGTKTLFYTLCGAEMFKNPKYKSVIVDSYVYKDFLSTQTFNTYAEDSLTGDVVYKLYASLGYLEYVSVYLPNLQLAENAEYPSIVRKFRESVKKLKNQQTHDDILADLNNAKSDVEDIKADKATIVESLAMTVKISEIISPITNSSIGKDLILYAACDALGVKYTTDYVNEDTRDFEYNIADLSAILTSVSGKIDSFVAKYSVELDILDINLLKSAGYYYADKFNNWVSGDKVSKNTLTNILRKHLKVSKPLLSSIKQLITKLNTEKTIDFFAKALTNKDNNTEDENYLLTVNENIARAYAVKNVIDASKGSMTIDEYIGSIKADIKADNALANGVSDANIEKYLGKIKSFYLLSIDTFNAADGNFIVAMPEDSSGFKSVQDGLNNRWTELMKK